MTLRLTVGTLHKNQLMKRLAKIHVDWVRRFHAYRHLQVPLSVSVGLSRRPNPSPWVPTLRLQIRPVGFPRIACLTSFPNEFENFRWSKSGRWFSRNSDQQAWRLDLKCFITVWGGTANASAHLLGFPIYVVPNGFDIKILRLLWPGNHKSVSAWLIWSLTIKDWHSIGEALSVMCGCCSFTCVNIVWFSFVSRPVKSTQICGYGLQDLNFNSPDISPEFTHWPIQWVICVYNLKNTRLFKPTCLRSGF